jgi:RNA polymerase sigma factor (sigma-70 family)
MASDAQLITQAVDGDSEAFGQVVRRHQVAVHSFLARRSGPSDADDLLADVWISAFRSRATFDQSRESALPWLYGIARNTLRGYWRSSNRSAPVRDESIDPWAAVDDRLAALDTTMRLRSALNAITDEQREVLLLVAWEDLSPTEAAVVLGIPASTARSHLHRARLALRQSASVLIDPTL